MTKWDNLFHAAEERAQRWEATAIRCDVCRRPIATYNITRHYSCDPNSIIGMQCLCSGTCSQLRWGDQGTCVAACKPCRVMSGRPLRGKSKSTK